MPTFTHKSKYCVQIYTLNLKDLLFYIAYDTNNIVLLSPMPYSN